VTARPAGSVMPVERAQSLISFAWAFRLAEALARRTARSRDAEARAWGMEVIKTRWGGRTYRDPRVTQLAAFRAEHPARAAAGDWPKEWSR